MKCGILTEKKCLLHLIFNGKRENVKRNEIIRRNENTIFMATGMVCNNNYLKLEEEKIVRNCKSCKYEYEYNEKNSYIKFLKERLNMEYEILIKKMRSLHLISNPIMENARRNEIIRHNEGMIFKATGKICVNYYLLRMRNGL